MTIRKVNINTNSDLPQVKGEFYAHDKKSDIVFHTNFDPDDVVDREVWLVRFDWYFNEVDTITITDEEIMIYFNNHSKPLTGPLGLVYPSMTRGDAIDMIRHFESRMKSDER